jgi:hypothetical protein
MPRQEAKIIKHPTEITIEYLIPLYITVRNDGDGPRITKVVVDGEADLSVPSAYEGAYTPEGDRLDDFNSVVGEARHLIECDSPAEWPAWEIPLVAIEPSLLCAGWARGVESIPLSLEEYMPNGTKLYRVLWEIEVEAETPLEAAEKARHYQVKPGTTATVFEVAEVHPYAVRRYGDPVVIDLTQDAD